MHYATFVLGPRSERKPAHSSRRDKALAPQEGAWGEGAAAPCGSKRTGLAGRSEGTTGYL